MTTFKTPLGTVLPLLSLKGKDYLQVPHRLVWFREEHKDWTIITSFLTLDDQTAVCRAEIIDNDGRIRAMAHKREDQKHFADHMEKAETGAIGRALAMIGYGTQFAPDLDEHERIVDAPTVRQIPLKSVGKKPTDIKTPVKTNQPSLGEPPALTRPVIQTALGSFGKTLPEAATTVNQTHTAAAPSSLTSKPIPTETPATTTPMESKLTAPLETKVLATPAQKKMIAARLKKFEYSDEQIIAFIKHHTKVMHSDGLTMDHIRILVQAIDSIEQQKQQSVK